MHRGDSVVLESDHLHEYQAPVQALKRDWAFHDAKNSRLSLVSSIVARSSLKNSLL